MRNHGDTLSAAPYLACEEITQGVLDAGATPDGNYHGYHGAPTAAAASESRTSVAKLLMKADVNLYKRGDEGEGTALYAVVSAGLTDTVTVPLDAHDSLETFAGMSGMTCVTQ